MSYELRCSEFLPEPTGQREFILITHTCTEEPDAEEIAEANEIALMTGFV